jgi:isoleucyl-tRNA synthetase
MKPYPDLPATTAELEREVLARWAREETFRQSLERTKSGRPFVFYEGPPTANGRPGIHHVFSRTIKDAVARFRTMQGRYVRRMAGWDTHGLPVEIEAERRLGISGKPEIEAVGIERFNEVCRESVLQYTEEWERFSGRLGYWLDYSDPYVTYHADYIESVWHLLKRIWDDGRIYRGHKILPYCPRCGTGLSSHEVAQGYREVKDPSLYLEMEVEGADGEADPERSFLVWTTTPWTLVANVALAVDPEIEYAEVERERGGRAILAAARVAALFGEEARVLRTFPGAELVGMRYRRPFDWVATRPEEEERAWRVVAADFVSDEDGTGIVHMAPAFGADDYAVGQRESLPVLLPVDDRGRFREEIPEVGGEFVKDADERLVRLLKERGTLFRFAREPHSYPHCWRCRSPLLYMARDSWFIRTTEVRGELLENNAQVRWHPPEMGSGRFGEWLENNVDWAISRTRYWGTPLPAWVCDAEPEHVEFIGAFAELSERVGGLPEDFDPHRPFIDAHAWPCPRQGCGGTMRRTPEVIDVWFDSGAMPFAQWHYPFENQDRFREQFPADFICEGVDQTRGWFYSLMAISTLMGMGPAYRNVIVNDLILDAEGQKMSKSRGNVLDPWEVFEEHGVDAVRWSLLASSNPWLPKRVDPEGFREVQRKLLDTLRQSYRFFALYAGIEGWRPGDDAPAVHARPQLDRWVLSRLASVAAEVEGAAERYDLTRAVRAIADFVVDDVSNWYVRRSRARFWGSGDADDTRAAFATLHTVLLDSCRMMAPFAPFLPDWLHRALSDGESVHLARFPTLPGEWRDPVLEDGMQAVRTLAGLGRAAREEAGIRVRQPLAALHAVVPAGVALDEELLAALRDELNVKRVEFMGRAEELVSFTARPNFRALGQRFGKATPRVAEAVRDLPSAALAEFVRGQPLRVTLDGEEHLLEAGEVEVTQEARGEMAVQGAGGFTAALDPVITPELRAEGLARELVNRVQRLRRETGLEVSDRIRLRVLAPWEGIVEAARAHGDLIAGEVLAVGGVEAALSSPGQEGGGDGWHEVEIEEQRVHLAIERVEGAS